ncbi:minor tail protein [Gordonia phage Jellybones]|uniref:Minor tail protein n=1 Tax=Gordonia phage Jellybones TaxID=2653716 RepID=A0A5Q2WEE8_9CAUD|nr:minor tail protein [Gordonia phage Jellybones]QGH76172.1 minor tail protein [Gordonia phage Jellybones]
MATGFGDWGNSVKVHSVLREIARKEVERLRPAPRLAEVVSIDHDEKKVMVKFVGETNVVPVPYTSTAPANNGQWVRVNGTTHDRYIEDVIGQSDTDRRLEFAEGQIDELLKQVVGPDWKEEDDGQLGVTIGDFFESIGGEADLGGLEQAVDGSYEGEDENLNNIQGVIARLRRLAGGIINPSRVPQLPVGSISNEPGPNLLSSFGGFSSADTISGDGVWTYDATIGNTAPGSAKAVADGTLKILSSEAIAVGAGQTLQIGGWVRWAGATASGSAFRLLVIPYIDGAAQTPVEIAKVDSPGANGQSTLGLVNWVVPASITFVRVRVTVEASVTAGEVWWDDLVLRKAGTTIPQTFVGGLAQKLTDLDENDTGLDDSIGNLAKNINDAVTATVEDIGEGAGDILNAFFTIFDLNRTTQAAEKAALEAKQILAAMNNQEDTGGDGMSWSTDFDAANGQPLNPADWQNVNNILHRQNGAGVPDSGGTFGATAVTVRNTNSDSQKCSFIISRIHGQNAYSGAYVRASATLSSGVRCIVNESGDLQLSRVGGSTFLSVNHAAGFKVGDQIEVRCNSTYYYIYKNGKQIYSYNDVANSVPTGALYRFCAMYMSRTGNVLYYYESPRFASFYMSDWYIPPGGPVNAFWQGTLIQYNSLATKLDNAVYFILPAT